MHTKTRKQVYSKRIKEDLLIDEPLYYVDEKTGIFSKVVAGVAAVFLSLFGLLSL